ncbi:MAG: glycosyltransferase [Candidatus Thiothrix putei]|uniref:Glycosyltransferase n=1 Tax=Candidatus Thiothrix putei TaxID=3080811 RepID=A0AA95HF47_9GAMM|nr:MAG: glycosyltransferase [Candidatus Thiothrix putei]
MKKLNVILIISPESWDSHTVSKHNYAITLSQQGFTVYFLNPFNDTKRQPQIIKIQENLYTVTSSKVAKGLRYYPGFLRHWLERRWLEKLEKKINAFIDTIWLFENSRFFDLCFAENRLKIYHQVDLNQNFNPKKAVTTSDICFCTSNIIRNNLLKFSTNIYKIHHGLAKIDSNIEIKREQFKVFNKQAIQCIYMGNLDMLYLDVELLANIASHFSDVQFHFVGGYNKNGRLYKLSEKLTNIHWWGKVDSTIISFILKHADLLLVTYQEHHHSDQSSPHKFMEYFASGKVIVATYTDEYKDKRHLLEMVDHNKDYLDAIKKVISNLDYYNSHDKQQQRIAFAQEHTYEKQLDRIFTLLKKHQLV